MAVHLVRDQGHAGSIPATPTKEMQMRADVVFPDQQPLGQEEQPPADGDCARHVKYEEGVAIGVMLIALALFARFVSRQERRA